MTFLIKVVFPDPKKPESTITFSLDIFLWLRKNYYMLINCSHEFI